MAVSLVIEVILEKVLIIFGKHVPKLKCPKLGWLKCCNGMIMVGKLANEFVSENRISMIVPSLSALVRTPSF